MGRAENIIIKDVAFEANVRPFRKPCIFDDGDGTDSNPDQSINQSVNQSVNQFHHFCPYTGAIFKTKIFT